MRASAADIGPVSVDLDNDVLRQIRHAASPHTSPSSAGLFPCGLATCKRRLASMPQDFTGRLRAGRKLKAGADGRIEALPRRLHWLEQNRASEISHHTRPTSFLVGDADRDDKLFARGTSRKTSASIAIFYNRRTETQLIFICAA